MGRSVCLAEVLLPARQRARGTITKKLPSAPSISPLVCQGDTANENHFLQRLVNPLQVFSPCCRDQLESKSSEQPLVTPEIISNVGRKCSFLEHCKDNKTTPLARQAY